MAQSATARSTTNGPDMPTFMEHVRELQVRLFGIVLAFIVVAAAAYPFFDKITAILVAPLKDDQQLVYLTPGGAFGFIIKVCIYIGIIGALPVIIYNLYRFIMPAVKPVHLKTVLKYTIASLLLALTGIVFAYNVSLPASLYFLTSFNLHDIKAMLTIDSYFSFVMTYLLAGAVLFQLPLIMMIVNSVSPLTPGKLMSYQRHMIIGSFVVAAIVSPTPDALNQILLASPIVVMYQLGILLVWLKNRKSVDGRRRLAKQPAPAEPSSSYAGQGGSGEHTKYLEQILNEELPKRVPQQRQVSSPQPLAVAPHKPLAQQPHRRPAVRQVSEMVGRIPAGAVPKPVLPKTRVAAPAPVIHKKPIDSIAPPTTAKPIVPAAPQPIASVSTPEVIAPKPPVRTRPMIRAAAQPHRVMQRTYAQPATRRQTVSTPFRIPARYGNSSLDGVVARQVPQRRPTL